MHQAHKTSASKKTRKKTFPACRPIPRKKGKKKKKILSFPLKFCVAFFCYCCWFWFFFLGWVAFLLYKCIYIFLFFFLFYCFLQILASAVLSVTLSLTLKVSSCVFLFLSVSLVVYSFSIHPLKNLAYLLLLFLPWHFWFFLSLSFLLRASVSSAIPCLRLAPFVLSNCASSFTVFKPKGLLQNNQSQICVWILVCAYICLLKYY